MLEKLTSNLNFHGDALVLRAQRQGVLSSNIANADTPGFKARDFDFSSELAAASKSAPSNNQTRIATTDARHFGSMQRESDGGFSVSTLSYRSNPQASADGNSVDLDRERANFAENTMRYEASLRFINGQMRQILTAIRGE